MNAQLGISLGMEVSQVEKAMDENPDAVAAVSYTHLEICGITEEQLPKLYESWEVVGTLKPEIAKELGFSENVKVVACLLYTSDVYKRQRCGRG